MCISTGWSGALPLVEPDHRWDQKPQNRLYISKVEVVLSTKTGDKVLDPSGWNPSQEDSDSSVFVLGVTLGVALGPEVSL